jgi:hypothetical protein
MDKISKTKETCKNMKKKLLTTGAMVLLGFAANAQSVSAAEVPVSNSTVVMTGGKDRWYSVKREYDITFQ